MKKVIVDTSIWISFLNSAEFTDHFQQLIDQDRMLRHKLVELELRVGQIKPREKFFNDYSTLPEAKLPNFDIITSFIEKEKLYGKGLSVIDISIYASARMNDSLVWTSDKNLRKLCEEKKIHYQLRKETL
ncbi:MAG: PIN domain-containing protein [Leptospiraceae bacterium]|nr:PIN domain-containing protein [Leptospiraceae bacterium]